MNTGTTSQDAGGDLLALWERAAAAAPGERDDSLLLAAFGPDAPMASLGARNAALLGLRVHLFGAAQPLRCNCPHCGATAEFSIDCPSLSQSLLPSSEAARTHTLEAEGYRLEFRVPDVHDLREGCPQDDDRSAFVGKLLARCVSRCERDDASPCAPDDLPAAVTQALSRRMEELEPGASVSFDLTCPECGQAWAAPMNVGDVVWSELQSRAERLLLDVDALARAYGWSEREVLALSPLRRAAYLQLVGSA